MNYKVALERLREMKNKKHNTTTTSTREGREGGAEGDVFSESGKDGTAKTAKTPQDDTPATIEDVLRVAEEIFPKEDRPAYTPVKLLPEQHNRNMVHTKTDKAKFFKGNWREVPPIDFRPPKREEN